MKASRRSTIALDLADSQVFISYAHTAADTPVAKCVAAALRSVGLRVWLDEQRLSGGDILQKALEEAIAQSSAGVFLVSATWLNRDWTRFELDQFGRLDANIVRRIPIFRAPRRDLTVPPELVRVLGFEWLEDDADADARLWQLYCAVTDTPPGDPVAWGERWRTLPKSGPAPARPVVAAPPARVRPSLRCDRAIQWTAIDEVAIDPNHHLVLLPGTAGQAHDHFVERVQRLLRMDPPRSIITVDWPSRPRSRDEFLEALGRSMGVAPEAVATEFAERLAFSNLLLLHPCIRARFVDPPLISYYTQWLPDAIGRAHGLRHVKCVQPIEFPRESIGGSVLSWLRLRSTPVQEGRDDAEQLITTLRTSAAPVLHAIRLRDLADITEDDLREFCDLSGLNDTQRQWLLAQIASRDATTPKDIFQAIDDFLPDARSMA